MEKFGKKSQEQTENFGFMEWNRIILTWLLELQNETFQLQNKKVFDAQSINGTKQSIYP